MQNSWLLWLPCSSFMGNLHIGFYNECTDYHSHVQCTVFLCFFILTNTSWGVITIILTPGYSLYSYPTPLKQISKHNTWTRIWKVEPSGRDLILFVFYYKRVCWYVIVWCVCRCVYTTASLETGHNFVELFFSRVWILEMEFTFLGLLGKTFYPMSHLAA